MKGFSMLNRYRMMDAFELIDLVADGDDLARALAERLDEVTAQLDEVTAQLDKVTDELSAAEDRLADGNDALA